MKINLFKLSSILLAASLSMTAAIPAHALTNSSQQLVSTTASIEDSQQIEKDNTSSWILFIGGPISIVLMFIFIAKVNGGSSQNTARNSISNTSSFSAGEYLGASSSDVGDCGGGDFSGGDCGGGF